MFKSAKNEVYCPLLAGGGVISKIAASDSLFLSLSPDTKLQKNNACTVVKLCTVYTQLKQNLNRSLFSILGVEYLMFCPGKNRE